MTTSANEEIEVISVNLSERKIMLADGQILDMDSLHEADGEEVEDEEFAVYATVQLPDGRWISVHFADYHKRVN